MARFAGTVHTKPVRDLSRQRRNLSQTVTVGIGLDHRQQLGLLTEKAPEERQIVAQRRGLDLEPLHRTRVREFHRRILHRFWINDHHPHRGLQPHNQMNRNSFW
jgi:hypothetical protein